MEKILTEAVVFDWVLTLNTTLKAGWNSGFKDTSTGNENDWNPKSLYDLWHLYSLGGEKNRKEAQSGTVDILILALEEKT